MLIIFFAERPFEVYFMHYFPVWKHQRALWISQQNLFTHVCQFFWVSRFARFFASSRPAPRIFTLAPPRPAGKSFALHIPGGYLIPAAGQKTGTAMAMSMCNQVRKWVQVFAFRVIPGIERGWWQLSWWVVPVHLSMIAKFMIAKFAIAPNHDELILIVGDCTGRTSTIFKLKLLPACN